MLVFSPVRVLRKRKSSDETEEILRRLDDFLNVESPQLAEWLCSVFQDQQTAVTYKELREAVLNGYEEQILQWQDDYARLINEYFAPIYLTAMKAGAKAWEEKLGGKLLYDSDNDVQNWIRERTAGLITNIGEETRAAVKMILWKGQQENWTAAQIARHIRPCIGLTQSDAAANARYQQSVYDSLRKAHPRMTEASAAKKAQDAALKYAARQHRARADMIANTELAFAYNRGENMSIRNAMRDGLMGPCVKIWRTAGSERVCPRCGALNGKEIGFDESFDIKGKELFPGMHETPPAHPRCRCVVQYKEIAAPARGLRSGEGQRKAPDHPVPQELGRIDFKNKDVVQSTVEYFEPQIAKQAVENAIVITKEGRVILCVGHLNGVYPDEDLGEELRGAVVTHNHPVGSDNEWSFSKADIDLFTLYELSVLRGIDEKYVYELNRDANVVENMPTLAEVLQDGELARHAKVVEKARELGYGYRRKKR